MQGGDRIYALARWRRTPSTLDHTMVSKERASVLRMQPVRKHEDLPASAWAWVAALLLCASYLATSVYISSRRLFWYDEIVTVLFSRLPDLPTLWKAMFVGADRQPLPYFLIVRLSEDRFGQNEMAARLPSAVPVSLGMLVVFDCARRL